MLSWFTHF